MKYSLLFTFLIIGLFSFRPITTKPKTTFDSYFRNSTYSFIDRAKFNKWNYENKDTAVFTFSLIKGDCCGGVPNAAIMKAKILNDTIFYNDGRIPIDNCDRTIGTCGALIDFVINKKKYPNYKKLKWKIVSQNK